MQNMLGQRFDIKQPGKHTLIQIPRYASVTNTLLRVQALAAQDGGECSEMYFKTINITGEWADEDQNGGYTYAADVPGKSHGWQSVGRVHIKVAWGRTSAGTTYLNFFVRHLKGSGHDVGGILGMDDYRLAAKASVACEEIVMLHAGLLDHAREMSMAAADV